MHEPLSHTLAQLVNEPTTATGLTLNRLLDKTAGRSGYLLVIVLCLPFMIPVSIPGLSTIMGSIIILLMLRQALGRPPRLPRFLGERELPPRVRQRVMGGSIGFLRLLERFVRPRKTQWLTWRPAIVTHCLLIAFLALLLALPLPSPPFFFSNSIPSYAIVVLAACLMEEDGLSIWVGYALLVANLVFFSLIGGVIAEVLLRAWNAITQRLFGL